ncbi:MAG: hypothetical protein FJ291_19965 [Planctomycetes bacterium]|nr:hypothetical protein [Planctomycetota bacterium]
MIRVCPPFLAAAFFPRFSCPSVSSSSSSNLVAFALQSFDDEDDDDNDDDLGFRLASAVGAALA